MLRTPAILLGRVSPNVAWRVLSCSVVMFGIFFAASKPKTGYFVANWELAMTEVSKWPDRIPIVRSVHRGCPSLDYPIAESHPRAVVGPQFGAEIWIRVVVFEGTPAPSKRVAGGIAIQGPILGFPKWS